MASDSDETSNLTALALLTPFIIVCAVGVFFYAPVLHGATTGALPTEQRTDTAIRFEKLDTEPDQVDITESNLSSGTIERVDNAIDNDKLVYNGDGEEVPNKFPEGATYRHGDEYYEVTYVESTTGKYPPVGYISSPDVTLTFMSVAVFFSSFALITTGYYITSIVGMGNSWHYETKDLVFYILMAGDVMVAATAALLLF